MTPVRKSRHVRGIGLQCPSRSDVGIRAFIPCRIHIASVRKGLHVRGIGRSRPLRSGEGKRGLPGLLRMTPVRKGRHVRGIGRRRSLRSGMGIRALIPCLVHIAPVRKSRHIRGIGRSCSLRSGAGERGVFKLPPRLTVQQSNDRVVLSFLLGRLRVPVSHLRHLRRRLPLWPLDRGVCPSVHQHRDDLRVAVGRRDVQGRSPIR